mgnify:CR=1 FL=1
MSRRLSLRLPEVMLGIHPGFGGTVRAVRLIGVHRGDGSDAHRAQTCAPTRRCAPGSSIGSRPAADAEARRGPLMALDQPKRADARRCCSGCCRWRRCVGRAPEDPGAGARAGPGASTTRPLRDRRPVAPPRCEPRTAYEAEARSVAELVCTPTSRNLVRVFFLQERLKGHGRADCPRCREACHVVGAGVDGRRHRRLVRAARTSASRLQDRGSRVHRARARARAEYFEKRAGSPGEADERDAPRRVRAPTW